MDAESLVERLDTALVDGDRAALDALLHPAFEGRLADGMPFGGGTHHGAVAMRRDGWGANRAAGHADAGRATRASGLLPRSGRRSRAGGLVLTGERVADYA